jgi:hypothetical protein
MAPPIPSATFVSLLFAIWPPYKNEIAAILYAARTHRQSFLRCMGAFLSG